MKRLKPLSIAAGLLTLLGAAGLTHVSETTAAGAAAAGPGNSIARVYDVAYDATASRTVYTVPGTISRGDTFIVTGYIYPGGTIPSEGNFSPFTPGAIGTWTCRGVYNHDLADLAAGAEPMVFTTQCFQFNDGTLIVTDGPEGMATHMRAVTGGAGAAASAFGHVKQEFLSFNETMDVDAMAGMNFRFTFSMRH
jgi:hypothetical protein